ncbi:MAG TPA: hypothetical protein VH281_04350 [Gaiellaceae bacterium]
MAGERVSERPLAPPGSAPLAWIRSSVWSLAAAGLVLVAIVFRVLLSRRMPGPWIMADEVTYSELAKSFAESHRMLYHGRPRTFQTIYPVFVSPAWLADPIPTAYGIAKGLNAVLMTLAAVPFWFWARRLMPAVHAFVALVLFLLLPAFIYTNEIMTENLAFPAVLLALFTIAVALERPTPWRQLLAVAAIGFACLARLQSLVLLIGLPTAVLLKGLLDAQAAGARRPWRAMLAVVRQFAWALGIILVGAIGYLVFKFAQGASPSAVLGTYEGTQSGYSVSGVARWFVLHVAELPYSVGLIPVCAFIVLAGSALRRGAVTTPAQRAFLAVSLGVAPWMILQVAAFASRFSFRVEERNMLYLGPLFLLALLLWIAEGLPRPPVLTAVAAVVPFVLLVSLPLDTLLNVSIRSDTFSFSPLLRLESRLSGGLTDVRIVLALGGIVAAVAFVSLPRRYAAPVFVVGVALFLAVSSKSAFGGARGLALGARAAPGATDVNWIDDRLGSDESVVFVNDQPDTGNPHLLWQTEFWNRSVHPLLNITTPHDVLGDTAVVDPATGEITAALPDVARDAAAAQYAVAPTTTSLAGRVVERTGQLALYRVDQPLRIARSASGIFSDGWMGATAALVEYSPPGGRRGVLVLRFSLPKGVPAERVTVRQGGRAREVAVPPGATRVVRIAPGRGPSHVDLSVAPTFSPAALGVSTDTRQLGVLVSVQSLPR